MNSLASNAECNCLSDQQAEDLLSEAMEPAEAGRFFDHIETCADCQSLLEEATKPQRIIRNLSDSQVEVWSRLFEESVTEDSLLKRLGRSGLLESRSTQDGDFLIDTAPTVNLPENGPYPDPKFPKNRSPSVPLIPGYKIGRSIGSGGMGDVYIAHQESMNREVAIKVMRSTQSSDTKARFVREAHAIGRMQHQNIVSAFDAGESEGHLYMVMQLADGVDLSRHVRQSGPMSIADACKVARQVALGLSAAHEAGLLHRDIKPSNVMLTNEGTAKILDLGLARFQEAPEYQGEPSDNSTIMGTLDYLSPEQARDANSVDPRSDIYSLGCMLFTLLSGAPPFTGDAYKTVSKKLLAHATEERPVPRDSDGASTIPDALASIIRSMMAIDPDDRPANALAVADSLAVFCDPATQGQQSNDVGQGSRHWTKWFGFAAGLVLLGVITIRFKDGTTMTIETDKPVASFEVKNDVGNESNEATRSSLESTAEIAPPQLIKSFQTPKSPLCGFCFDPSMTAAYSTDESGTVLKWDFENGASEKVYQFQTKTMGRAIEITPKRDALFVGGGFGFAKLNLGTGEAEWTYPGSSNRWAAWIPGTDLIAIGRAIETTILRSTDGKVVSSLRMSSGQVADFAADGKRMAVCLRREERAAVVDILEDGFEIKPFAENGFEANGVALSPDEKHLIAVGDEFTFVWDINTGDVLRKHRTRNMRPQFYLKPVGDTGLFLTLRGNLRNQLVLWDPLTNTDHLEIQIPPTFDFTVSPDGRSVLTSDFVSDRLISGGALHLWSLVPDGKPAHGALDKSTP